jgi:hypothetical protein
MDSRRHKTRELTVKSVQKVMAPYSEEHLHTLQQVLAFFGIAPKLERILWATLKKEYERRKLHAETMTYGGRYSEVDPTHRRLREEKAAAKEHAAQATEAKGKGESPKNPRGPRTTEVAEPEKLVTVVGICPCGGNMMGKPIPKCEKLKKQPSFYSECEKCTRYVEVWRQIKRNRTVHYEEEGG